MDIVTILGILLGFVLMAWAVLSGGSFHSYVDVASVLITCGGALASTLVAIPGTRLRKILQVGMKTIRHESQSPQKLISDMVSFAETARRDGILSLESVCKDVEDPFVVRGIQMAVDGTDPELIEQIMTTELENLVERHENGRFIFATLGKYAPAFGMIGTLIGLVAMLANMDDPSMIGPGMATAILTTLYGAVIANVLFLPMSEKLAIRSSEEILLKSIIIKGIISIQSGDNPRIVEQKLRTFLPPSARDDEEKEKEAA